MMPGNRFFIDRPKVDIPEAYVALDIPRLQIQGDNDIPEFRERFAEYCPKNDPLVRHLVIPGADRITGGPYRIVPHPNYVAVIAEGIALPLVHTGWLTALVFTVLNAILLLSFRIPTEDRALTTLAAGAR